MNRDAAARAVRTALEAILRRHSSRPVEMELVLGAGGHGLDSLALVEFSVGLESAHGIEIPEDFWSDLAGRTPGDFARLLAGE